MAVICCHQQVEAGGSPKKSIKNRTFHFITIEKTCWICRLFFSSGLVLPASITHLLMSGCADRGGRNANQSCLERKRLANCQSSLFILQGGRTKNIEEHRGTSNMCKLKCLILFFIWRETPTTKSMQSCHHLLVTKEKNEKEVQ